MAEGRKPLSSADKYTRKEQVVFVTGIFVGEQLLSIWVDPHGVHGRDLMCSLTLLFSSGLRVPPWRDDFRDAVWITSP